MNNKTTLLFLTLILLLSITCACSKVSSEEVTESFVSVTEEAGPTTSQSDSHTRATNITEETYYEEILYTDIYGSEVDFGDISDAFDNEIQILMNSSEYNEALHDERINLILDLLERLSIDGTEQYPFPLVVPDSYSYGEEGDVIGCDLVNGWRELILLENPGEDLC